MINYALSNLVKNGDFKEIKGGKSLIRQKW